MADTLTCPFCGGNVIPYTSGYSEYDHGCEKCEAGFAIDREKGHVHSRRWDREAGKGVQSEFPLSQLQTPQA